MKRNTRTLDCRCSTKDLKVETQWNHETLLHISQLSKMIYTNVTLQGVFIVVIQKSKICTYRIWHRRKSFRWWPETLKQMFQHSHISTVVVAARARAHAQKHPIHTSWINHDDWVTITCTMNYFFLICFFKWSYLPPACGPLLCDQLPLRGWWEQPRPWSEVWLIYNRPCIGRSEYPGRL